MFRYDTIVVGNGLVGAAAARYLAECGLRVAVIGPGEPTEPINHGGVFSSHYDQGRLVSGFGGDPTWATIGRLAIAQFPSLQRRSGVEFHDAVGRLSAIRLDDAQRAMLRSRIDGAEGETVELLGRNGRSWHDRFPAVEFPPGLDVLHEQGGAGVIDPRALIRAQNIMAMQADAEVIEQQIAGIDASVGDVVIRSVTGERYTAERALVACGAFTNSPGLLRQSVAIRCKTETTVWGVVSAATAEALADLPAITSDVDDPALDDIYIAPPQRYPDGVHRIKLGANTRHESWPTTIDEIGQWFRAGESERDRPALERQLRRHLPEVDFTEVTSHRCIVTYTPSGFPTIDRASGDETGRLIVAVGGNGQGAGGSDTLGMLAAGVVVGDVWPDDLPRSPFQATHDWQPGGQGRRAAQRAAAQTE